MKPPRPAPTRRVIATALGSAALGAALLGAGVAPLSAQTSADQSARAELRNPQGEPVGTATLRDTPAGVLIHVKFSGLPPGSHAFHIHDVGKCDAPSFKSAGGHYNPTERQHGLLNPEGPHAGDMPNIHVLRSGKLELEVLSGVDSVQDDLLSGDATALVVHSGPDDYHTDPAGAAGPRIACGVITAEGTPSAPAAD